MNQRRIPAVILLSAVGLITSFFALHAVYKRNTATYFQNQLIAAPDGRLDTLCRQIAELGENGTAMLAEALGSNRRPVAQAAKKELFKRLERWRAFSDRRYLLQATVLAEALAAQVDRLDPAARADAVDLAERILLRPPQGDAIEMNKLLTANEKILRAGLNAKNQADQVKLISALDTARLKIDVPGADLPSPFDGPNLSEKYIAKSAAATGDLSNGNTLGSQERSPEDESQSGDSQANRPRSINQHEGARPLKPLDRPAEASRIPDRPDISTKAPPGANHIKSMSYIDSKTSDLALAASLAAEDIVALMKKLNDEDDSKAAEAQAELIRRGCAAVQIELARRLFDANPAVRKKLARELPDMRGVDPTAWLLQLCRDENADVRMEALSFLATSTNPAVLDEVEKIAQNDSDPRINRVADRVSQQRNARQ